MIVNRSRVIFAMACVVLAGVIALSVGLSTRGGRGAGGGGGDIGGPFQVVDQDGKPRDEKMLKGKWSLVFFGFTNCPDICPTTMQALAAAEDRLGPKAKGLQAVFVTIDPERDTAPILKAYIGNEGFPKGVIGLTGTPDQIARIAKAYRVYYAKSGEGPDYTMNHSSVIYLMDPKGRFVRPLSAEQTPDQLAEQIRDAMRQGG